MSTRFLYLMLSRQGKGLILPWTIQPLLCLMSSRLIDVTLLEKLRENHIHQVFIPAGCTGELQPLDVSVNEQFKASMKAHFARWYSNEVKESLDQGLEVANIRIDLRASVLTPLHGNWLITAISSLKDKKEVIQTGLERSEIMEYVSQK